MPQRRPGPEEGVLRLVACPACHTQFDVSGTAEEAFDCPCGTSVENRVLGAVDAEVRRCRSCGALLADGAAACEYCRARVVRDGNLSLICPECYARNSEDARFCTGCGAAFRPQPLPSAMPETDCVRCGEHERGPMALRTIGGVTVHECRGCHGLWVPGSSFDDLVSRAIEAWKTNPQSIGDPRRTGGNPVAEPVEYRECPRCRSLMQRVNYRRTSGVIIDRCHDHGTWLDADELERIAGFIVSGGLDRAQTAEGTTMKVAEMRHPQPGRASAAFEQILSEHRPVGRRGTTFLDSIAGFLNELLG